MWWHTVRYGRGRGNWRMEWVASTLHTTSEHGVSSITTVDAHTSAASSRLNWRPRRFKWLVHFAERRNLVSARVPSLFNWPLSQLWTYHAEISARACLACHPYEHTKEACLSRTCSASSDMNRQWCCHLDHRCSSSSYQAQLIVLLRGTQESNQLH